MIEAYRTWLDHKNELQMGTKRMIARTECTPVAVARDHLWQGATVVVAEEDLPALRVALYPDTGKAIDKYYMEGRNAFLQGRYLVDNPYLLGMVEWKEWARGWAEVSCTPIDDGPASLNEVVNEHYPEDWE